MKYFNGTGWSDSDIRGERDGVPSDPHPRKMTTLELIELDEDEIEVLRRLKAQQEQTWD